MSVPVLSLEGRVAIVTGASQGIGRALAAGFAEAGASVLLAARTVSSLENVAREIAAQGGKALAVPTDVTDSGQVSRMVQRAVDEFGRIDVLVNCAGGAGKTPMVPLLDMTEDVWDAIVDFNLKGVYLCCRAAGRIMVEQRSGSIINFSSGSGVVPVVNQTHYCAAKAGVNHFTRVLAAEWGRYNVRVNAISPGLTATRSTVDGLTPDMYERLSRSIPLGRVGQPEDMLGVALFLASEASAFISGVIIPVSGGPQ